MRRNFASASLLAAVLLAHPSSVGAQAPDAAARTATTLRLETGKQIWEGGCVSCHGHGGRGQSLNRTGFEPPDTFLDFADCPTSTVESDLQWRAVITHGGPARGFSRIMPAFGDLLTPGQIDQVIDYMRGMCR